MKKWVIVVVVVATLWLIAGVAAYVSLRQASSLPDVVKSMEQVPGAEGGDWPATWSPDGQRILCGSHGVLTINADGTDEVYLGEGDCPVWSPDGSRIAFATDNGLEVMNTDGGKRRLLVDLAKILSPLSIDKRVESTAWSPDGSKIAFEAWAFVPDPSDSSEQTGESVDDMWIVNVDGSGMTQLTTDSEGVRDLVWSPDGQRIAFVSSRNGGRVDIWTSKVDGTDLQQLTSSEAQDFDVSWSPDGSKIAFASGYSPDKEEDPEIWIMDSDGSNKVQLTKGSESYEKPAWSPDGAMIAFSSTRLGPLGDIWVMNADGSGKTRLTRTSHSSFTCTSKEICYQEPQWSPDGTKLMFPNMLTQWEGWGSSSTRWDRLWVMELNLEKGLS